MSKTRELRQRVETARKPKYPGYAVRIQRLTKDDEVGDVRIMDYGMSPYCRYRVASFLPGRSVCVEGDTPKTEPERDAWCETCLSG